MILVTGATGLIGSHLLFELTKSGNKVRAIKRDHSNTALVKNLFAANSSTYETQLDFIEWVEADITDYNSIIKALEDIHVVYHCAAMVSFNANDYEEMLKTNVGGTANIVDACLELGNKNICHVSSVSALGSELKEGFVTEDSVWGKTKGKSGYAQSKFRSEMEVWRGIELGLNAVIVNPSVVLGPGQWNTGSGQLFGAVSKGFPFYTLGVTGFVDVRDVVKAMITAVNKEIWGKRYLLNSENLCHKDIFGLIAKAMNKKPPTIKVTPLFSRIAWPLAWLVSLLIRKKPSITKETAKSGHKKTYYSAALAEKELNISFRPIAEAVKNTVSVGRLQ